MNDNETYLALIEKQRRWIYGLPESEYLLPLMKLRMSAAEAGFLLKIPHVPTALDRLQEAVGGDPEELQALLDILAGKGLIMKMAGSKGVRYALHDPFFWFYRMPGYEGKRDEFNLKISPLLNKYYKESMVRVVHSHTHKGLRTIPVNTALEDGQQILPFEDATAIIDNSKVVCVSTCSCRHRKNLDPDETSCRHETRTCLHFDALAGYLVGSGLAEAISKEEAHAIARNCADAGLVHAAANTVHGIDTICNCCSCCCAFISAEALLPDGTSRGHQRSNYLANRDQAKCKGCGLCAKRCPMGALALVRDDPAHPEIVYSAEKCIGCGVCAHKCPTGALRLQRRPKEEHYPDNILELVQHMLKDQGLF